MDNKEIKYASTEKIYEETISSAFVKYQHVVDYIQDPTKTGTPNESVVICCMIEESKQSCGVQSYRGRPIGH